MEARSVLTAVLLADSFTQVRIEIADVQELNKNGSGTR